MASALVEAIIFSYLYRDGKITTKTRLYLEYPHHALSKMSPWQDVYRKKCFQKPKARQHIEDARNLPRMCATF